MSTPELRRAAIDQALASTRIEGHEPTPEFLADCEKVIAGAMTTGQMVEQARKRALELQAKSLGSTDGSA